MADITDFLRCPRTGSRLIREGDSLHSEMGGYRYPIVQGIPDFRLFDPPYMSRAEECELARRLEEAGRETSHEQLVLWYEGGCIDQPKAGTCRERHDSFLLGLRERGPRRLLEMLEKVNCVVPEGGTVLDLGCGSGEAIAELKKHGAARIIGLDISLDNLVLARKLLEEQGVEALLVAGCAEALPFDDDFFDFVYSPDVIEHVSSQSEYLKQARRVLKSGGTVLLNSPNRFSVVCPEPHVGIWFLTFLPRPLIDPVCRLFGKGAYVGKRLVSLPELRKLLRGTFERFEIFSRTSNPEAVSVFGRLFRALSPWSEKLFAYIGDQHVVKACKQDAGFTGRC